MPPESFEDDRDILALLSALSHSLYGMSSPSFEEEDDGRELF